MYVYICVYMHMHAGTLQARKGHKYEEKDAMNWRRREDMGGVKGKKGKERNNIIIF